MHTARRRDDRATGVFGSAFGFTVFLIFLLFTVQLLFGLYVRTTVTAVATDLAQLAANEGPGATTPERRAYYEDEARRRLGDYGDDASFEFTLVDADLVDMRGGRAGAARSSSRADAEPPAARQLSRLTPSQRHSVGYSLACLTACSAYLARDLAGLRPLGTHTVPKEEWSLLMC